MIPGLTPRDEVLPSPTFLPGEVWFQIAGYLHLNELCRFKEVCKLFCEISQDRFGWRDGLKHAYREETGSTQPLCLEMLRFDIREKAALSIWDEARVQAFSSVPEIEELLDTRLISSKQLEILLPSELKALTEYSCLVKHGVPVRFVAELATDEAALRINEELANRFVLLLQRSKIRPKHLEGLTHAEFEKLFQHAVVALFQANKLTYEGFWALTLEERAVIGDPLISDLVVRGILTLDEAKALARAEHQETMERFRHPGVYKLLERGLVTKAEVRSYSSEEALRLKNIAVVDLILTKVLTVQEVKGLTSRELHILKNPAIAELIREGILHKEEALRLCDSVLARLGDTVIAGLIRENVLTKDAGSVLSDRSFLRLRHDAIAQLVRVGMKEQSHRQHSWMRRCTHFFDSVLTVGGAKKLTKTQFVNLSDEGVRSLIQLKKLTLGQAKRLSWDAFARLSSKAVVHSIYQDVLAVKEARKLSKSAFARVCLPAVCELICEGKLLFSSALQLSDQQITHLSDPVTRSLILKGDLSVEQVLARWENKKKHGISEAGFRIKNLGFKDASESCSLDATSGEFSF